APAYGKGRNQERCGARQFVGETEGGGSRGYIAKANCSALVGQGFENARFQQSCSQRRRVFYVEPDRGQVLNGIALFFHERHQSPTRSDDLSSHGTVTDKELDGIALSRKIVAKLHERLEFSVRIA